MAEPSGFGLERITLTDEPSDDDRKQSFASKRDGYYSSQRVSHSSGTRTPKSRGKSVSYREPPGYDYLDEAAVPLPLENPYDNPSYKAQSGLEENIREARGNAPSAQTGRSSERQESAPRRRNISQPKRDNQDEQDLTEVAAPPPVQKAVDEQHPRDVERQRHLEDEEGDEPPDRQPPRESAPDEQPVSKLLTELYTISYLIFFAIFGTLARLGTQWITFYPGTPIVTPVIWANFGGSLIMGFMAEDQGLFRDNPPRSPADEANGEEKRRHSKIVEDLKADALKRKKAIPLYIGITTGFCGSFTSFSSFARDFFLALSNNLPTPINHPHPGTLAPATTSTVSRNGGYSFEAFIHVVIMTIALSLGGLIAGAQIALFLEPFTPRIHGNFIKRFVDRGVVVLAFGCWLGAILLAILPPDRPGGPSSRGSWSNETWRGEVIFALVFAPLGCLLRFYVSMKLNGLVPSFPLGTFSVNMLGTAIEGMCYDIQHVGVGTMGMVGGGRVGCQVLQGVMDGFCGCLTTVSTWVAEMNGLKRKHGWAYAFGSVLGGICLMLVIMGSVRWSAGFSSPVCNTGYTSKING